jgi:hypothetical protein
VASIPNRRALACAAACLVAAAVAVVPGTASATPRPSLHAVQVRVDALNREAGDAAPAIVSLSIGDDANTAVRVLISLVAAGVIVGAVVFSKRKSIALAEESDAATAPPARV